MFVILTIISHSQPFLLSTQLFIPSVRIFARHDVVPVFLQLRGTGASVSALYAAEDPVRGVHGLACRFLSMARSSSGAPRVVVSVQRQLTLLTGEEEISQSYTIGTASLRSVPPGYAPRGMGPDMFTVDYEGEIKMSPQVTVGGFNVGKFRVSVRLRSYLCILLDLIQITVIGFHRAVHSTLRHCSERL